MRILVVDDDHAVRDSLRRALRLEGYAVDLATGGAEALERFRQGLVEPDAVILDVLMPGVDGIDTCRAIRRSSDVPILMLTARDAIDDRVEGLDAGADDYLVKPFVVKELFARLRALLRRSTGAEAGVLTFADVELNTQTREVSRAGRPIVLTRTEFSLLELFMTRPNRVLSRDAIFETVWGYDMSFASNSLEVFVGYLRRKLEADGAPRLIRTVRGLGYMLREA